MSYQYSTNVTAATPGTIMKLLKNHLITNGWKLMGSSSGSGGSITQSTTVAAGSNGVTLPIAGGILNVAHATTVAPRAFPASGNVTVYNNAGAAQTIAYTGRSASTLTGCTGGTGTLATGGIVSYDWWTTDAIAETSGAWLRIQAPLANSVNRELMFQCGTNGTQYYQIRYSYTNTFTANTPTATTAPTATSSQIILDGTSAGGLIFIDASGMTSMVVCDNASPYGFAMSSNGTATYADGIFMDPLVSGTYDTGDTDPYVFQAGSGIYTSAGLGITTPTGAPLCYLKKGLAGEGFVTVGAIAPYNQGYAGTAAFLGVDPINANDVALDLNWSRNIAETAPRGWKGMSTYFKFILVSRNKKDTHSSLGTNSRNYMVCSTGELIMIRWSGAVPA